MLKNLSILHRNRTTYRIGLLQAKAYRELKHVTAEHLKPFDLSTTHWAFLGLLLDSGALSPSSAAEELGVEAPFISVMAHTLKERGLVAEEKDAEDSRRKVLCLTPKGESFVAEAESYMRTKMRPLIAGISPASLGAYMHVLEHVLLNTKKK